MKKIAISFLQIAVITVVVLLLFNNIEVYICYLLKEPSNNKPTYAVLSYLALTSDICLTSTIEYSHVFKRIWVRTLTWGFPFIYFNNDRVNRGLLFRKIYFLRSEGKRGRKISFYLIYLNAFPRLLFMHLLVV